MMNSLILTQRSYSMGYQHTTQAQVECLGSPGPEYQDKSKRH